MRHPWDMRRSLEHSVQVCTTPIETLRIALANSIAHSAKSFSSFLGGYSLFLGAIAGIICVDFWICRSRRLSVTSLYNTRGTHWYTGGVNFRAVIAFVCGIAPNMPGLAAACGQSGVPKGATYLYSLSWLVSTLVAGFVYWAGWKIKPFPIAEKRELYIEGSEAEIYAPEETNSVTGKAPDAKISTGPGV